MTRQFAADAKLLGWKLLSLRLWDSRGILYKERHNICNRNCIFYCAKPLTPPSMCICRAHTSFDFFASFEGGGSFICRSYLVLKRGFRWRVKFHDFLFCAVPGELTNKPNKLLTSAFSPSSCRPSEKYLNLVVTYFTFVLNVKIVFDYFRLSPLIESCKVCHQYAMFMRELSLIGTYEKSEQSISWVQVLLFFRFNNTLWSTAISY